MMSRILLGSLMVTMALSQANAQTSPIIEKDVLVSGFKLHYAEAGSGPPVILLHGVWGNWAEWKYIIPVLARDFRVLAPDHIGLGDSDKPLANYHTGMLAEFVVGFMKALHIPTATVMGNAWGGAVAMYLAIHEPTRVERLGLVNGWLAYRRPPGEPSPAPDPALQRYRQAMIGSLREDTRQVLLHRVYNDSLVTEVWLDEMHHRRLETFYTFTKLLASLAEADAPWVGATEAEVRGMRVPTLILYAKDDVLGPPVSVVERLHRDITGSQLVILEQTGHGPQLEKPAEVNRSIGMFLKMGKVTR